MKYRHRLLRILLVFVITGAGAVLAPPAPAAANGTSITVLTEDDFRSGYDGGAGEWIGEWVESDIETNVAAFWLDGDVFLDNTGHADARNNHIVMSGGNAADIFYRQVDLSQATQVTLTFDYAPRGDNEGTGDAKDDVYVEVAATCAAAAAEWETVIHLVGDTHAYPDYNPGSGPVTWFTATAELPEAGIGATTCLRYRVTGHLGNDEAFLLDNVALSYALAPPDLSVSGRVWDDDGDGVKDSPNTEAGIPDVKLNLYREAGEEYQGAPLWVQVGSVDTEADGTYVFTATHGLRFADNTYQVRIDPTNYGPGKPLQGTGHTITPIGTADDVDSDGIPLIDGGIGAEFTTAASSVVDLDNLDFGFVKDNPTCLPTIDFRTDAEGNYLFPGRPGVDGDRISNQWAGWGLTITVTSKSGGDYSDHPVLIYDSSGAFTTYDEDLLTPRERVLEVKPSEPTPAEGEPGFNDTFLGNMLIINRTSNLREPDDYASGGNMIFTFASPVSVTQLIYMDAEKSEDTTIEAEDKNGNSVGDPVHTRGFGNNSVDYLTLNKTGVAELTAKFAGSGAIPTINFCAPTTVEKYVVGDYVWKDVDEDGIQDDDEDGIGAVTVTLYTASGQLVATTTTDDGGKYLFSDLPAGTYFIVFTKPSNLVLTKANQGSDDEVDSDANDPFGSTGTQFRTASFPLGPGAPYEDLSWDAGFYEETTAVLVTGFAGTDGGVWTQALVAGLSIAAVGAAALPQLKRKRQR